MIFKLPDLGEGLTEAEIVEWHVKVGDHIAADAPLVSVETAKAIVEIPAPYSGRIVKVFGNTGDLVETHHPLVEYESEQTGKSDSGTVVGVVQVGEEAVEDKAVSVSQKTPVGVKAVPAVRALARRLNVDLAVVKPSGPEGLVTTADVERVATLYDQLEPPEPLRGVRRSMAHNMALSHAEVVPATLCDDADINAWPAETDCTIRLVRAMVKGCAAQPALNAWYDAQSMSRRLLGKVDLGIAVDTEDGLFVPVLHDVGNRDSEDLRAGLDRLIADVTARTVPPEELRGFSIILSNFGTIAGRYAAAVVVPPTVAILAAGKMRDEVVAVDGAPKVRRILPLSLTIDHRAVTGGEAGRFLAAVIADLKSED